jgi:competence protein ComEA
MKITRFYLAALFTAFCLLCTPAITMADEMQAQEVVAVNINSASAEELAEKLDGIGESRAALIVKFREEHGAFTSVEQLLEIKGVGTATLEKNREKIQL